MKKGFHLITDEHPNPSITLFVPFSRLWMVDTWFEKFEEVDLPMRNKHLADISLFIYIDPDNDVLAKKIVDEKIRDLARGRIKNIRLYYAKSEQLDDNSHYIVRRRRIAEIHNTAKQYMVGDYIIGLEDDTTLVSRETLLKMYKHVFDLDKAGYVTANEVGRWGIQHVGAWNFKLKKGKIHWKQSVIQENEEEDIEQVGGGGLFCFISPMEVYQAHDFMDFEKHHDTGPDLVYGVTVKEMGYKAYIDYSLYCRHHLINGDVLLPGQGDTVQIAFDMDNNWLPQITRRSHEKGLHE